MLGESVGGNEIRFSHVDFFSREIQGNPSPNNHPEGWGGHAWHLPVTGWELDERFVIRIPAKEKKLDAAASISLNLNVPCM